MASPDPLGKRALFWLPVEAEPSREPGGPPRPRPAGRRALFSHDVQPGAASELELDPEVPVEGRGRFRLACSRCAGVTRVGILDLAILQFPVGWWVPGRRFDRRMTCPRCRRRAWMSLTLAR